MRKLLIALCACAALVPAIASADDFMNHLSTAECDRRRHANMSHNVSSCRNRMLQPMAIKLCDAIHASHETVLTADELTRRKPESCGLIVDGDSIHRRSPSEAVVNGTPTL